MKVILTAPVKSLGKPMDIITVKNGFARNWLFPEGLAVPYSAAMEAEIAQMNAARQKERDEIMANAAHYAKQIAKIKLEFAAKASDKGVLFGAVNADMIAEKLADEHKISLAAADIDGNFKQVGDHTAQIKLGDQIAELKIKITAE